MACSRDDILKEILSSRSRLIAYAWTIVGDADVAEDILQDVSLDVLRKAEQINDLKHLRGWLMTATRLRSIEIRRSRLSRAKLLRPEVLDLLERAHLELAEVEDGSQMAALRRCVQQLSDRPRELLALRYEHGLKSSEIAHRTGRSLKSIYQMLTRTHSILRKCVRERIESSRGLQ